MSTSSLLRAASCTCWQLASATRCYEGSGEYETCHGPSATFRNSLLGASWLGFGAIKVVGALAINFQRTSSRTHECPSEHELYKSETTCRLLKAGRNYLGRFLGGVPLSRPGSGTPELTCKEDGTN